MNHPAVIESLPVAAPAQSLVEIKGHVQLVQQVMRGVMKEGIHFGVVPGTDKPTLLKAGAEVLCMTFRIAPKYRIEDLSSADEARYRIVCVGEHQQSGLVLGEGLGECSSMEEKYKWRRAVCDEEFDEAPEERKRVKFARGKQGSFYRNKQIRTEPADVANTVLKMGAKRAQVAMTINVTAAGDIFGQDLEEMEPELRESLTEGEGKRTVREPKPKQKPATVQQEGCINETQQRIIRNACGDPSVEDKVAEHFQVKELSEIPAAKVNEAIDKAKELSGSAA